MNHNFDGIPWDSVSARSRVLACRPPTLIVPPIANKSTLHGNATMAAIWQEAREAVAIAKRLVIFGYSLPTTDTSMRALLVGALGRNVEIDVVDPRAARVAEALRSIGLDVRSTCAVGSEAFDSLLRALERDCPFAETLGVFAHRTGPHYAGVRTPDGRIWPVVGIEDSAGAYVVLTHEEPCSWRDFVDDRTLRAVDLAAAAVAGDVLVRFASGTVEPLMVNGDPPNTEAEACTSRSDTAVHCHRDARRGARAHAVAGPDSAILCGDERLRKIACSCLRPI